MSESETDEETPVAKNKHTGLTIGYSVRFCTGLVLIILGAVSIGFYREMKPRELPYFLGAFLTGITMEIAVVVSARFYQTVKRRSATIKQKILCLRIEVIIFAASVILAFFGIIVVGVHGIQAPPCAAIYGSCTAAIYRGTTNFKLSVAILVMLLFSIIVNIAYIVVYWRTFKTEGVYLFKTGNRYNPQNRHRQTPISSDVSRGFDVAPNSYPGAILHAPVEQGMSNNQPGSINADPIVLNMRHGQPEPYQGAILSRPDNRNDQSPHGHRQQTNSWNGDPIVLNMRHGQPEPFQGAILSRPDNRNNRSPRGHRQQTSPRHGDPIVLNMRHGQPEPFQGAVLSLPDNRNNEGPHGHRQQTSPRHGDPIVLNMRHGQPEPFQGAILSTNPHERVNDSSNDNNRLVSELQLQNEHLREQLPRQQRLHELPEGQNATPTASDAEAPPPSYDACLKDPSKYFR